MKNALFAHVNSTDLNALRGLEGTEWVDLRRYGSQLPIADAGLLAYARGMVEWHRRNVRILFASLK